MIDWFIRRNRSTLSLFALLLIWGIWSYAVIPVSAEPEVTIPIISVATPLPGASPQDVVRLVTRPLEEELNNMEGIKEIVSYSRQGLSTIIIEFDVDFDVDEAVDDARTSVEQVRSKLPASIKEPVISEYSTRNFPLMTLAIYGDHVSENILVTTAEQLETRLEQLTEVRDADLQGVSEEIVAIVVDKERLEAYGLNLIQVARLVTSNNLLIPAGVQQSEHGSFAVQVPGTLKTAQDLLDLPLKTVRGIVVSLSDVASIQLGYKDPENFARINGKKTISLDIIRTADANDIATSRKVRAVMAAAEEHLPPGVSLVVANDDSAWTSDMVSQLSGNIITAITLVMTLVVSVLGFRAGVLVGLGIPSSFMAAFIFLNWLGLAFNFMVMFGLLLSMGMLIDGAIVVVELAARAQKAGLPLRQAYSFAANRMFWPIIASGMTTLAAFIPLMVWPGVTGKFMQYLPITVFAVLSASLLYSLVFTPVLGITFGRKTNNKKEMDIPTDLTNLELSGSTAAEMMATSTVHRIYGQIMLWSCRNPVLLMTSIILILFIILRSWTYFGAGTSFFISTEPTHANINIHTKGNFSQHELEMLSMDVDNRINDVSELESRYLNAGGERSSATGISRSADQISNIFIELKPKDEQARDGYTVLDDIRQRLKDLPGMIVQVARFQDGPPVGSPLSIKVLSNDSALAEAAAITLEAFMQLQDGLLNITSTRTRPQMEWHVEVDKTRAASMGVSLAEIGASIQMVTEGLKVDDYLPEKSNEEVDILVRLLPEQRTLSQMERMRVQTDNGMVPLSSFVKVVPLPGQDTITRSDQKYSFTLGAALTSTDILVSEKVREIKEWQLQGKLPDGVELIFGGAQEAEQETLLFLVEAAGVALFLMLIMLVTQFNSFYQALLILSAVAMSIAGVFLMLLLTGTVLSVVMGGMGLVTLAGVVVNNNIVLLDTFNHLRRNKPEMSVQEAAIQTGLERLRPVLLTTATTIFGLLPLAFSVSVDLLEQTIEPGSRVAAYWTQLASTLASGLFVSTILTLIFIPASLVLPGYLSEIFGKLKQKYLRRSAPPLGKI